LPQVVFLSLFLGLVTGIQSVTLQVDDAVKSVRIELSGREVARMEKAPWSAKIDFGHDLLPARLTAIAYDGHANEIARTSQLINLSRPPAEVEIVIRKEGERPVEAELVGRHRLHKTSTSGKLFVDGAEVTVGRDLRARLPQIDWSHTHVISAEMHFDDDQVARREMVIQAGFVGSADTELTPMLVSAKGKQPDSLEGCFSVRATAIEKPDALVVMVKDPSARGLNTDARALPLDAGTTEEILWPVSRPINAPGQPTAIAFPQSVNHSKVQTAGWLLLQRLTPTRASQEPRQFTDAVAVAAIAALEHPRRRAVVLLLSRNADHSLYSPVVVRRYLDAIGLPLFVWSADGPRPDLGKTWGTIDDVSTIMGQLAAVGKLNDALSRQRIVWVAADPLTALTASASDRCGLTPIAHP